MLRLRRWWRVNYDAFIARKTQLADDGGFAPIWMPTFLFDFQSYMIEWAIRKGRAAILADCGLGKTPMELVWAENVRRKTNRPVLLLTPLAVASQMLREAEKFGIDAQRSRDGVAHPCVTIANYDMLHRFDPTEFAGVVCDESSCIKALDGVLRSQVTEFMRKMPYRLLCTATAAPNDYIELGTHSEALSHLGFMDMLARFFKNNRNNSATNRMGKYDKNPQWRFRGHAERPFWRWVCSWARAMRRPSDYGFDDARFVLPALIEHGHVIKPRKAREGFLFSVPAIGLAEEREERRRTLAERCDLAAGLVADTGQPAVCWAHLNDEADLLERLIPGAIQVSGRDSDEQKEEKFDAFQSGQARVLVTKPIVGAWGLNWQHCAHMTTFTGHSFEQHYQTVRRFWRFGQMREVVVDHVASDGEQGVLRNLQRKSELADAMFSELVANMRGEIALERAWLKTEDKGEVPAWL